MKKIIISIMIMLISLELLSFVGSKFKLFLFNSTPIAYLTDEDGTGAHWRSEKELWGAWHKPNFKDRYVSDCFNINLNSNNVGARDNDFINPTGKNSIILLGDSFAEGHGVEINDTAQKQIENISGRNVLNFGSGGNFGPVQYYEIYKNLASSYDHDTVMIFFLPGNDFTDNDYEAFKSFNRDRNSSGKSRYRPYWKVDAKGYSTVYPDDAVPNENFGHLGEGLIGRTKRFLIRYTYFSNPIRSFYALKNMHSNTPNLNYSGYYDATYIQEDASLYYITKLFELVKQQGRRIEFVIIPGIEDIERFKNNGKQYKLKFWYKKLQDIENNNKHNFRVIDLMDYLPDSNYRELFLKCDPHWSPLGNQWAAKNISNHLSITKK